MWPFAPSLLTSHAPSEENTWTVLDAIRLSLFYSTTGVQARRGRPMRFLARNPHGTSETPRRSPSGNPVPLRIRARNASRFWPQTPFQAALPGNVIMRLKREEPPERAAVAKIGWH